MPGILSKKMQITRITTLCLQSILLILQFFALFACVGYFVNYIYVFANLRDEYYYPVIIFFTTNGLILMGIWNTVIIFLALLLIALIQQEGWAGMRRRAPRDTTVANTIANPGAQQYSYLDNNPPPDYNSVIMSKPPLTPPSYQSVELMPVQTVSSMSHWQRVNSSIFNRFGQRRLFGPPTTNGLIVIDQKKKSKNNDLIIIHPGMMQSDPGLFGRPLLNRLPDHRFWTDRRPYQEDSEGSEGSEGSEDSLTRVVN
ncbi:unnamed protein product [Oppiella nova]|uniref:Uncharacterized protein n=1 Tax=Oppiella nova TaxID=334625 RepID=A0A7R9QLC3_9ACAR|nr:unnamed protein product [Oppiella nova]CAG2168278.1 unnamed protein product [Oppiella nova]